MKKIIIYSSIFIFLLVSQLAEAQIIGQDAFLKSDHLELGLGRDGAFGTSTLPPPGYHERSGYGSLGFVADPDEDGWEVGTPDYCGDFFIPGSPVENLCLSIGANNYVNNYLSGYQQIPGSLSNYVNTAEVVSVDWTGSVAGIEVMQKVELPQDNNYIIINCVLTNTSDAPIDDIYFSRNVDPDNEVDLPGGSFATINTIIANPDGTSDQALVTAEGEAYGCTVALGAVSPIAKAVYGGFENIDAEALYNDPFFESEVGMSFTDDIAIALSFNVGTLAAGESILLTYGYLLDPDDIDDFLVDLVVGPNIQCKDVNVNASLSEVIVNAEDLNDGTTDDESAPEDIVFSFSGTDMNVNTMTFTCADVGAHPVMLYAYDEEGTVSAPCMATINVVDNVPPTISCPSDISVPNDMGICGAVVDFEVTASDNCYAGSVCTVGQTNNNSTFSGWAGAASSFTACETGNITSVTLYYNNAPVNEVTVEIRDGSDPGTAAILHSQLVPLSELSVGANVVNLDAPVSILENESNSIVIAGFNDGLAWHDTNTYADGFLYARNPGGTFTSFLDFELAFIINMGGETAPITYSHDPGDEFPVGITAVTASTMDPSGNSASCTFNVIVSDNEEPDVVVQDATVSLDENGNAVIMESDVIVSKSDNCGIVFTDIFPNNFTCADIGENIVSITVIDINGNATMEMVTVTVQDNSAPSAMCQDITVTITNDNAMITLEPGDIDNGSSDNCTTQLSLSQTEFSCNDIGDNTVTLTVSDGTNSSTCTATVTVVDMSNPEFVCPGSILVSAEDNECNVKVPMPMISVTDICGGSGATIEFSSPNGSFEEVGGEVIGTFATPLNEVTVTVTDEYGNESMCTFLVKVDDVEPPSIGNCHMLNPTEAESDNNCGAFVEWPDVIEAKDDCSLDGGLIEITSSHQSGDYFDWGVTEVVYTATDANGNSSTCSFDVIVGEQIDASYWVTGINGITFTFDNTTSNGDSYLWDFGDGTTSTLENPVHTFPSQGFYDVCLTVFHDCGEDTYCHTMRAFFGNMQSGGSEGLTDNNIKLQDQITSENEISNLLIYPNPAAGQAYLSLITSKEEIADITITDRMGRTVNSIKERILREGNQTIKLDTENLMSGVYYVKIASKSGVISEVKQLILIR